MNRAEALQLAVEIIDKQCVAPVKANGYTVDGWRSPTLEEKTKAIITMAEFLWEPDPVSTVSYLVEDDDPDA